MVLAVHTEFGNAATRGDDHVVIGSGGHQRCRLYQRMRRCGAERADVAAGRPVQPGDFRRGFGKVAAAALVHIPAGFLGTVYDKPDGAFLNARLLHNVQQGEHGRGFGHEVFQHDMSRKVRVDIVRAADIPHQRAFVIQRLGMIFRYGFCNGVRFGARFDFGEDLLSHQRMRGQLWLHFLHKRAGEPDEVEHVASLHQQQKLILRHDLAERSVARRTRHGFIVPRLFRLRQFFGREVADIRLVRRVLHRLTVAPDMLRQLLEIVRLRVEDAFGGLCGAVVHQHIGRMHQNIARCLYHAVHLFRPRFSLMKQ